MPSTHEAPYPYDIEIAEKGYLRPPDRIMRLIGESWYQRDSLPWFPPRQQQAAITEGLLPPQSESLRTIKDYSGGFAWSDAPETEGSVDAYAYTDAVDSGANGDGQGVDCSVAGMVILGPLMQSVTLTGGDGVFAGSFELTVGGTRYLYVVFGTKMFRTSDGVVFSAVQANAADLPAVLTGRPAVFQGAQTAPQVYFPLGGSTAFATWDGNPNAGFGRGTVTDNNKVLDFAVKDDACWALWLDSAGASPAYRINKFYDGVAGSVTANPSWGASIIVTDRSEAAQYLMYAHGRLYVGCNRSLRSPSDERGDLMQVVARYQPSADNFRWWTDWNEELWFNAQQGTYRLIPRGPNNVVYEQVGPEMLPDNRTPIRGPIRAKAGDDYCLYHFLRTEGGVTYLLKYRYYDNKRRAAFHSILRIGTYDVDFAWVSTVAGQPYLYFGTSNTTLRYIVLPRNGAYPPSDANYKYCAKGYLFESRQHGGLYFATKVLIAWTGRAQDLSTTEKILAYYRSGINDAFTQFSTVELVSDSGSRIGLSTPVSVIWWENRLSLERGTTTTKTPKLLASTASFALRPVAKGRFVLYVWIADYAATRAGNHDQRTAYDIEDTLVKLDSTASLSVIRNKRGLRYDVLVDEVKILHVLDEADEAVEAVARITASEFLARGIGTHAALSAYTHAQLGAYKHQQLSGLL